MHSNSSPERDQTDLQTIVGILPLGDIPILPLKVIAAHIGAYLQLKTQILAAQPVPSACFDTQRIQYDVGCILDFLEKGKRCQYPKIIAVLNADLFAPVFSYVLGEARQGGGYALVSLYRLRTCGPDDSCDDSLFLERVAKVALHELGHLFNLVHCSDSSCLMHCSGGPADLDHRRLRLCRYCNRFLKEKAARHGRWRSPTNGLVSEQWMDTK